MNRLKAEFLLMKFSLFSPLLENTLRFELNPGCAGVSHPQSGRLHYHCYSRGEK